MRRFLIITFIVLVALCLGLFVASHSGSRQQSLPDGSIIRIEKVGFTTNDERIELGGRLEKWRQTAVAFWQSKVLNKPRVFSTGMSSWYMNVDSRSNEPALYIYISRPVPGKGYSSVDAQRAQLIDGDGCVYNATQSGGSDDGRLPAGATTSMGGTGYSVGWFRFEA